eukprot:TRINITY_DN565_c0_g1_i8.p1 TRINITY_DN565_c0_g1~~TRINITY_DN565_c0_g1_i8.p1  ORF type:complete len:1898 (+),score=536.50 TRINITY_DN565_c0_g1_i8:75-5768(+)
MKSLTTVLVFILCVVSQPFVSMAIPVESKNQDDANLTSEHEDNNTNLDSLNDEVDDSDARQAELLKRFDAGVDVTDSVNIQVPETMTDEEFFDLKSYSEPAGQKVPLNGDVTDDDLKPFYGKITLAKHQVKGVMIHTFTKGQVVTHPDFAPIDASMHSHIKTVLRPVNALKKNSVLSMIKGHMSSSIADMMSSGRREQTVDLNSLESVATSDQDEEADDANALIDDMDESSFLKHSNTMEDLRQKGMILFSDPRDGVFSLTCQFMNKHSQHLKVGSVFSIPLGLFKITHIKAPGNAAAWQAGMTLNCNDDSLPYHITTSNADLTDAIKDATVHVEVTDNNPYSKSTTDGTVQDHSPEGMKAYNEQLYREMMRDHRILKATQAYDENTKNALADVDSTTWQLASQVGAKYAGNSPMAHEATREFRDAVHSAAESLFEDTRDDTIAQTVATMELQDMEDQDLVEDEEMEATADKDSEEVEDEDMFFRRISRAFRSIGRAFKRAFNSVTRFIKRTWNAVANAVTRAFRHMKSAVMKAVRAVSRVAKSVVRRLQKFAHDVSRAASRFANRIAKTAAKIGKSIAKVANSIAGAVVKMGKTLYRVGKALYKIGMFIVQVMNNGGTAELDLKEGLGVGFTVSNLDLTNQRDTYLDALKEKRKEKKEKAKKQEERLKKMTPEQREKEKKKIADRKAKRKEAKKNDKRSNAQKFKDHVDKEKKQAERAERKREAKEKKKNAKAKKNGSKKKSKKGKKKGKKMPGSVSMDILIRIIKAKIKAKVTLTLAIKLKTFKPKFLKVELKGSIDLLAKALVQINATYRAEKEKKVASKSITRFKFMIGPVPVWINCEGQFYVGVALTIKAGIQFNIGGSVKGSYRTGMQFDFTEKDKKKRIKAINKNSIKSQFKKPKGFRPCASVELEVFVRPQVGFKLYEFAGPTLGLEPYALLKFVPQGATECATVVETHEVVVKKNETPTDKGKNTISFYIGFRLKLGVQVGFKGKLWLDESIPLFEKEFKIFEFSLPIGKKTGNVGDVYDAARRLETIPTVELANMPVNRNPTKYYHLFDNETVSDKPMTAEELRAEGTKNQPSLEELADSIVEDMMDAERSESVGDSDGAAFREREINTHLHNIKLLIVERDTYGGVDIAKAIRSVHNHNIRSWNNRKRNINVQIRARYSRERALYNHYLHKYHHYNGRWHHFERLAYHARSRHMHRHYQHLRNIAARARHVYRHRFMHCWLYLQYREVEHLNHLMRKTQRIVHSLNLKINHERFLLTFQTRSTVCTNRANQLSQQLRWWDRHTHVWRKRNHHEHRLMVHNQHKLNHARAQYHQNARQTHHWIHLFHRHRAHWMMHRARIFHHRARVWHGRMNHFQRVVNHHRHMHIHWAHKERNGHNHIRSLRHRIRHERSQAHMFHVRWRNRVQFKTNPKNRKRYQQYLHERKQLRHYRHHMAVSAMHGRWGHYHFVHRHAIVWARRARLSELHMSTEKAFLMRKNYLQHLFNHHRRETKRQDDHMTHENNRNRHHVHTAGVLNAKVAHFRHVLARLPQQLQHVLNQITPHIRHHLHRANVHAARAAAASKRVRHFMDLAQTDRDRLHYFNIASRGRASKAAHLQARNRILRMLKTPNLLKLRKEGQKARQQRFVVIRDLIRVEKMHIPEDKRAKAIAQLRVALLETRRVLDREWTTFAEIRNIAKANGVKHPNLDPVSSPHIRKLEEAKLNAKLVSIKEQRRLCSLKRSTFEREPKVISARYGPMNVKAKLQKLFAKGSPTLVISKNQYNHVFGDPRHGVYKHFRVTWRDSLGRVHKGSWGENQTAVMVLQIECGNQQRKATVISAKYAHRDVKAKLQAMFNKGGATVVVHNFNHAFGDPRPGHVKHLRVTWRDEKGRTHTRSWREGHTAVMTL